jgi:hypothetical protein
MKKKTHKLSLKSENDLILIGISSQENDYRICWAINQDLGINFTKTENLKAFNQKFNVEQEFSLFIYENEETLIKYHLIANKCENGYYIPELKNIDFFMQISGDISDDYKKVLVNKLKSIDVIKGVFIIDTDVLKSKDRLIS